MPSLPPSKATLEHVSSGLPILLASQALRKLLPSTWSPSFNQISWELPRSSSVISRWLRQVAYEICLFYPNTKNKYLMVSYLNCQSSHIFRFLTFGFLIQLNTAIERVSVIITQWHLLRVLKELHTWPYPFAQPKALLGPWWYFLEDSNPFGVWKSSFFPSTHCPQHPYFLFSSVQSGKPIPQSRLMRINHHSLSLTFTK